MRIFFLLLVFFLTTTAVHANEHLKKHAQFQALHVQKSIEAIDLTLLDASDYVERNPDQEELVLHETLGKYVEKAPGLRAVIVTDKKGNLVVDSFTYPAKTINLSDREYVVYAMKQKDRALHMGSPLIGRSSGVAFLPFSRPLFDSNNVVNGVIAGVMHPGFLIKQESLCAKCLVGVFTEKETLVSYPSNAQYPEGYLAKLRQVEEGVVFDYELNGHPIESYHIYNEKYGLYIVVSMLKKN